MRPGDQLSLQASRERLIEIGKLLLATTGADGVADNIAHAICDATGYDRAVITEIDRHGMLVGRAGCGVELSYVRQVHELPEDIPVFHAIRTGSGPIVIRPNNIRDAIPGKYVDLFEVEGTLIASPLRSERLGLMGIIFTDRAGKIFQPSSLEQQVIEDFSSLAALAMQNSILLDRSRELARVIERRRIGTDLHDGVTQQLFTAELTLQELRDIPDLPRCAQPLLDQLACQLATASSQLRTALFELASDDSQDVEEPLDTWVRRRLDEFVHDHGVSADIEFRGTLRPPSGASRDIIERTVREGLANIAKHANATQVLIIVRCGVAWMTVEVLDDGDGNEMTVRTQLSHPTELSFGLRSLAMDTDHIGGRLWISTAPRLGGLRLSVSVPVCPANET